MFTTLISVTQLQSMQTSGVPLLVLDCTFDLMNPAAGYAQYVEQHIAGAQHADLDKHLATHDPALRVNGGRHPLPQREVFAAWLQSVGVNQDTQVVVYDRNGMNYCGRLWWMLKWCGHDAVAVLDGGLKAWMNASGALASGAEAAHAPGNFALREPLVKLVTTAAVSGHLNDGTQTLIDARGAPRYRGEVEPLDPVAGHIPGALNRPFNTNLNADGFFKSADELRTEFTALIGSAKPETVVHHCGSGVSAVPNVLAMEVAGLGRTALYAGSWSEWCNTPGLPCEKS
ncbi:sulfurtransferase [Limnohabitans sp. INBF002]|uniref:sulfurtransferase n=1 Tax=Limnohabitans sp. INBF002 TaxID=2986280 RepID=UPI0023773FA5|nr:sulfurtransferase [Limnohabitans sp. INBF002]BDU53552.1 sulfurtransferase [Limnohabitans sp. INBF002]